MTARPWTAQEDAILRACDTRAAAEAALAPPPAETPVPRVVALTDWTKGMDPR